MPLLPSPSQASFSLQICIPTATSRPIIFTIIVTMSRVTDLTIENIIRKYEHRQQVLRSDLDAQDTARPRGDLPLGSGVSTPEFSFTIGKTEINRKLEDEERIQRTQKKQEGRMKQEEGSFSTDRETILRQLEQAEERLARSQRNFAEASRKCDQLQRREREIELNGRLKGKNYEQFEGKVAALERENANYKECIASKDTNIAVLREKLKEKNERLIECERIVSELKSQLVASNAAGQQAKDQEQERQREKEALIERLRNELITLQKVAGDREAQRKELLAEIEKSYKSHQEELEVIRKSYVQVEEEYQQWIDNCNTEKLAIIKEYQQKLIEARSNTTPSKPLTAFEDEIQRRERESARLIALTARQSSDIKQLRSELQASERMKAQLVHKVSSFENSLIDKTQALSSLEAAYSSLLQQLKEEEDRTCELRQRYNGVNRQFVELRGKFSVLFQSLEATKRDGQGQGAELVRVRKELVLCREQLERSRGNEMALNAKLADATRAIKDRLAKAEQQREENLTQLMAQRLQNARLQEQLQETKQYLKRQYDLSLENTRKELQQQINSGSKTTRSNIDPEKQQLYLQLRALQRKYELLAHQIVTVDEVMDIANKVKRRHEPSKKNMHA